MPRLRVALSGNGPVERWGINNDYALTSAVPDFATLQTIASALATALNASSPFKTGFCSDMTITEVKLLHYPLFSGVANLVATQAAGPITGTSTAVHAPQVCAVASLRTNLAGRSHRGRTYWPYRGSQVAASGALSAPGQAIVAAAAQAMKTAVVTACTASSIGAAWGVFSPTLSSMTPIVDVLVGSQCDTQRRRNVNRAETYSVSPVTGTEIEVPDQDAKDIVDAAISHFLNQPISLSDAAQAVQALATVVSVIEE